MNRIGTELMIILLKSEADQPLSLKDKGIMLYGIFVVIILGLIIRDTLHKKEKE